MNSVGSCFHWVSRTHRIHLLRLQADMWREVFIPLTSVAKFPLIWIRLKLRPSFSSCCLPKSTSDLRILPLLCVTISNGGSAVHAVSAMTFSRSDQDKCKWGMRDPGNRRGLCAGSAWCVVNSPRAVAADRSLCLLCTHAADGSSRMKSSLNRLVVTWTCPILAHQRPGRQVCCQHHRKGCVRSLLSRLAFSNWSTV